MTIINETSPLILDRHNRNILVFNMNTFVCDIVISLMLSIWDLSYFILDKMYISILKYNRCQRKLSFLNYHTNMTMIGNLYLKAMIRYSSIVDYFNGFTYKSQFITFGIYCMLYPTHILI